MAYFGLYPTQLHYSTNMTASQGVLKQRFLHARWDGLRVAQLTVSKHGSQLSGNHYHYCYAILCNRVCLVAQRQYNLELCSVLSRMTVLGNHMCTS